MTPEAINLEMAWLDGWTACSTVGMHGYYRHDDDEHCRKNPRGGVSALLLPNYTEDLNAVARVYSKTDNALTGGIQKELRMAVFGRKSDKSRCDLSWIGESKVCNATALERCEAILRAVGKWVEG